MKYISISLICLGLVMALFALNMDISANDTNIVNLSLLSLRQNYLMVGGILFIAGIILVTKAQGIKSNEKELIIKGELKASKMAILSQYWQQKSLGERMVLASIAVAICSLILDWSIIHVDNINYSYGSKAGVKSIITLLVIWFYPIFMMIKNNPLPFYKGAVVSLISLVWIIIEINNSISVNTILNGTDLKDVTFLIGSGMYVVAVASIMLLTGVIITQWSKSK